MQFSDIGPLHRCEDGSVVGRCVLGKRRLKGSFG